MNNSPLISIIIPCYNVEPFITTTLQSVLSQTYQNWECIIVNDGSSDDSEKIITDWIIRDQRFNYIFQENQGLSGSRNTGLHICKGEYVYFLDADDLLNEITIESLVSLLDQEIDIVFGKTATTSAQNNNIISCLEHDLPTNTKIANSNKNLLIKVIENPVNCVAHNRLYKKEFLQKNNLKFEPGLLHEDELWFFETLFYANAIILSDTVTYYYNIGNQNSITNTFSVKNTESYLKILEIIYSKYYLNNELIKFKDVISTYITHFKIKIVTHCYYLTEKKDKFYIENLISSKFKNINVEGNNVLYNLKTKKLHKNFNYLMNKVLLDNVLKYLRFYKSKSFKKILKRNLIYYKTFFKNG